MQSFAWHSAKSIGEAVSGPNATVADAMLAGSGSVVKAGGIDLLDLMKEGLLRPDRVVNLRDIPGLDAITQDESGVQIGAMVTLEQIAAHPLLRRRYTALADAAGSTASPQIRHIATIGGNVLQRPRCWYFRSAAHVCARKGGDPCFAFVGENQYHAVFAQYGCAIVHPSTVATALVAFDARVVLANADGGTRTVPLAQFFVGPEVDMTRENTLRAGEVLTAILLPQLTDNVRSVFLKQQEKPSFDWSIADVAAVLDYVEGRCRHASIVLGAAAPVPWRAKEAEAKLVGQTIDAASAQAAGEAAIAGATPLRHNTYKLPIFNTLVRRAVLAAVGIT